MTAPESYRQTHASSGEKHLESAGRHAGNAHDRASHTVRIPFILSMTFAITTSPNQFPVITYSMKRTRLQKHLPPPRWHHAPCSVGSPPPPATTATTSLTSTWAVSNGVCDVPRTNRRALVAPPRASLIMRRVLHLVRSRACFIHPTLCLCLPLAPSRA